MLFKLFVVQLLTLELRGQVRNPTQTQRNVKVPPLITMQPPKKLAFREGESIELPCVAEGEPQPEYSWLMNDNDFSPSGNDGRVAIQPGVGTLIFANPLKRDEAIYQCIASNVVGRSISIKIDLRLAILDQFPQNPAVSHFPAIGHRLTLPCVPPRSFPSAEVYWAVSKPGAGVIPIDLTDRVTQDPEGNLHFVNVIQEDAESGGTYVCVAKNDVMRSSQRGSYQKINPAGDTPTGTTTDLIWASPTHQPSLLNATWRIKCIFSGYPTPRVEWNREYLPLPDSSRRHLESFGQELVVENVQFEDSGQYECRGNNDQTMVPIRRSFELKVEAAPYWNKKPENVNAAEGEDAMFYCSANGIPEPLISWFLNGKPISKQDANPKRIVESGKLTFLDMTKDDAMVIQCNATNKHGYIFTNAYLNVLTEAPFIKIPPQKNQKVAEGQTVNLTCEVYGSPRPVVNWKKGQEQLTGGRFKVLENGHLQITDVSLVDAGRYTCNATNKLNYTSAVGSLIVRRKTLIRMAPKDVMVFEDTEAKFTCTATTDPEEVDNLRIFWKKDDQLIDYRSAQRMFQNDMDNSLTISGTYHQDTGKYTCVASNGLDESEAPAQLIVQGIPDPPTNLILRCKDRERIAEIYWAPGKENYAPILNFIVQYNTTFAQDTWIDILSNFTQNDRKHSYIMSPWANYTFRVIARNKIGLSMPSEHTKNICRTEPEAPTKNPENVIGEGDRPNNLVIYWTPMPMIEQNGPGYTYVVSWRLKGMDKWTTERINRPEQYHHVVAGSVETYKAYEVMVKSWNSVGDCTVNPEPVIGYSGENEPLVSPQNLKVVPNTTTGSSALLTWDPVVDSPDDIRGFFKGYRIQFWKTKYPVESFREADFIIQAPKQYPRPREKRQALQNQINYTVTNLPPASDVTVQVRVLNKYYTGPASDRIEFTTDQGKPGPPKTFSVEIRGSTHFELHWEKPLEPNGVLLGYNISYQIITGLNLGRIQYRVPIDNADTLRTRLTGLRPATDYRIYLAAVTKAGKGEDIFLDTSTTSSGMPASPTFDVIDVNETSMLVQWEPSRSGNPGSVFYVQYRPRGRYHWRHTPDEELRYSMVIDSLDPGTFYELRVVSKSGTGMETPAEWQLAMTGGIAPGRIKLSSAGWFYGIFASLLLIIILLILFVLAKRVQDEWWHEKEAEIDEATRFNLAAVAGQQIGRGIENNYLQSSQVMDMSHQSLSGGNMSEKIPFHSHEAESDSDVDEYVPNAEPHNLSGPSGGAPNFSQPPSYSFEQEPPRQSAFRAPNAFKMLNQSGDMQSFV